MLQREVLVAGLVLFATDIVMATPMNSTGRAVGLNVKHFVNTTQKIWTYTTTSTGLVRCEVDQMQSVHPLSISFRRSFLCNETRMNVRLRGVFDRLYKQRMTLYDKSTWQFVCVENLLHMARDRSCAVFRIESLTERNNIRYDLRVKNSAIHQRPHQDCRRYLHRVKGQDILYNIYSRDCQRALSPRQHNT
uniref:Lipocalin n=1 Tax=Rhipicephalus appendiculatus TaxID=34631 RepID=A0A131YNG9_RHIAP